MSTNEKHLPSALTNEGKVSEKDKLLLINEDKSNNFDVKSNNLDVKSNEELFKQALVEGLNRRFDKTIEEAKKIEQIEEMAKIIDYGVLHGEETYGMATIATVKGIAKRLYNAGYRKQSEGEWIHDINNLYGCSNCLGRETMSPKKLKPYCPNCGAKMKGGDE